MLAAAVVLALVLLVAAVSWGGRVDRAADDAADADPLSPHGAA